MKRKVLAAFSSSLRFAFLFFVSKKPLFRKFSSNFFAALENLMMFLNFGLDNLNLEKDKMRELLPKGPQDRTSTDDPSRATWHSNSVWFHGSWF